MKNTGLENEDIRRIKAVFTNYPEVERVLLYGSRAMGTYRPASDIDLALIGENIDSSLQTTIEFELDDLMLPYKFDLSIYDRIKNSALQAHIERVGITLYDAVAVDG